MKLEFPDSFFKGEEREGFFVEEEMKRAWAAQLEVLKDFSDVCERHEIKWSLGYGSLLGAVRHKGFIPWDDDLDVFMLRDEYKKFLKVAKELPKGYFSKNIHTHSEADYIYRLVNHPSIDFSEENLKKFHGCPYCCGIDIFPLDYIPRDPKEFEIYKNLITITVSAASQIEEKALSRDEERKLLSDIEKITRVKIDRGRDKVMQLKELSDRIFSMYTEAESDNIGTAIRQIKWDNYYAPKECFAEYIMVPFETTMVPIFAGYDMILRAYYGDYMVKYRNVSHDYPFYKSQKEIIEKMLNKEN